MFLVLLIAFVSMASFVILGVVKKNKAHFKKAVVSLVIAVIAFVGFTLAYDDDKSVEAEEPEIEEEAEKKDPESEIIEEPEVELPKELHNLRVTDVRNDTTGNWKKVVDSKNFNMPKNAITYAEEYMEDGEVHYLISFATNTTAMINDLGGMLFVNITEYEEKEEHSADTIGGGMLLKSYNIYKDSGKIEDLDDLDE